MRRLWKRPGFLAVIIFRLAATPASQAVPAARLWTADHVPEAQRWNEDPLMQFHSPSFVHAEPAVVAPEVVVPEASPADAAVVGVAVSGVGVGVALVTVERVVEAWVAAGTSTEADTVAKIPPRLLEDV